MYKLMAAISLLIRQYFLPNPFECFGDYAWFYNLIAGAILTLVSRAIVGTFYTSGEAPVIGSFLFLLAYAALTGILWLLGLVNFAWWAIALLVAALIAVFVVYLKKEVW